ncbi:hypothetical protein [Opitutus sp. ER46]|uniref:tetratricopeptide repeat protein n=1 Tax=Opitutus sp. ER46 TaxID=2161864 RepID=UPI000D30C595|nr:hypothetical protein [Opitutus sp. ER46]PTX91415.1 hypothetical protein DB354_16090 [Opitutus sp. ER46]
MNARLNPRLLLLALTLALLERSPAGGAEEPATVQLPPMIVSENTSDRPWRYVGTPQMEVLGRCDDGVLKDMVTRTYRLNELLGMLLPPALQHQTTHPRQVILVDAKSVPGLSREFLAQFGGLTYARPPATSNPSPAPGRPGQPGVVVDPSVPGTALPPLPGEARIQTIPSPVLYDLDRVATFAIAERSSIDLTAMCFTPEYVRLLLVGRTPELPAWYVAAWLRLYPACDFRDKAIHVAPLIWLNEAETRVLRDDPDAPRRVMPLVDLLGGWPSAADKAAVEHWTVQAELLLRWALLNPERRAALARYIGTAARAGDSEALFRECFGFGYADARDYLSDYLPTAVRKGVVFELAKPAKPPRLRPRDATPAEIGRIKGDWERLETAFVRKRYPEFVGPYLMLARQTITRAREVAPQDPGLLAVAGLLECDEGDHAAARPLLEAAVAGARCSPRVYVELAGLRLEDFTRSDDNEFQPLGPGQASFVLETLAPALEQQPALPATYALMAAVWARSATGVGPKEIALLDEALLRFPRHIPLLYFGAMVMAQHRSIDAALTLARTGRALPQPAAMQKRFDELTAVLTKAQADRAPRK